MIFALMNVLPQTLNIIINNNTIIGVNITMNDEEIEEILLQIVQEFVKPENQRQLDNQKLASSVFYSFAIGVLNNNEFEVDKINDLLYVVDWLHEREDVLAGFNSEVKK